MNGGPPLPPVPDLIPISALRKTNKVRHSSPHKEVMGEQRSRRTGKQPAIDLIDSAQSRGASAAPQAPSRKARSERHRKSERRREHRVNRRRSSSKQAPLSIHSSPERPANPRVNPIFVWVRQVDTRIVDVKCEDYDKRNRILLTKTAQGWRAIPRTETLVPSFREAADEGHHRVRKSRKSGRIKRKSAAVQVDEDMQDSHSLYRGSPTWTAPVNIESHLPSHTIHIPKNRHPTPTEDRLESNISSVNSEQSCDAQTQNVKCSASNVCDVSPLDNLLAVAELEFNQQIQTEDWNKSTNSELVDDSTDECAFNDIPEDSKDYLDNIANLNKLIDSCTKEHEDRNERDQYDGEKAEDCDYNEEDDNNLAMDDILSRLEQSLRSPEMCSQNNAECNTSQQKQEILQENSVEVSPDSNKFEEGKQTEQQPEENPNSTVVDTSNANQSQENENENIVESSTLSETNEDSPTDLSVTKTTNMSKYTNCDDLIPTDLSIPKAKPLPLSPRPPSQDSETIQSPQPSGIPAVPPSPDILHSTTAGKPKSIFSDSQVSTNTPKPAIHTDNFTPLDLGKSRKSASPTVTCSEEANIVNSSQSDMEPVAKKFKADITLKTLLNADLAKNNHENASSKNNQEQTSAPAQTPRLLELLTSETEVDPLTQLKQVIADKALNVPDPMLVPKEKLSQLLLAPAREIPRLLKQRPELRLPEALAFPQLLKDPDILVITLAQLETIIAKQCVGLPLDKDAATAVKDKVAEKPVEVAKKGNEDKKSKVEKNRGDEERASKQKKDEQSRGGINELANDIDAATNAAFNQMMWLPYLNQLENAMSFGNNPEFLKMLNNMMPMYPGSLPPMPPELAHLLNASRLPIPPLGFPMQPQMNYQNLDCAMWQEAMLQANILRPRHAVDMFKPNFKEFADQIAKKSQPHQKPTSSVSKAPNPGHPYFVPPQPMQHNPFMNPPTQAPNIPVPQMNQQHKQSRKSSQQQAYFNKNQYQRFDPALYKMQNMYQQNQRHQQVVQQQQNMFHQNQDVGAGYKGHRSNKPYSYPRAPSSSRETTGRKPEEFSRLMTTQPMDLSGMQKSKAKHHGIDQSKMLRYEDTTPEVGSTTASIEEMQDAQKHLWHPLFGNQKGYGGNPWNWSTVSATGE